MQLTLFALGAAVPIGIYRMQETEFYDVGELQKWLSNCHFLVIMYSITSDLSFSHVVRHLKRIEAERERANMGHIPISYQVILIGYDLQ